MATVPVVLLPVKMRLPLPDVGKRTKKIQTPVPADPEILPQTSIQFIKLARRKPKPSDKRRKKEAASYLQPLLLPLEA